MSKTYTSQLLAKRSPGAVRRPGSLDRATVDMYQSFMAGYVRRINEATFNVSIGDVQLGSARHTRLAQIDLESRIITFSRYAVENVPERCRRYLVIHQLAHIIEPSHSEAFWSLVERYEPNYRQVGRQLELAFRRNVREEQVSEMELQNPLSGRMERPKLLMNERVATGDIHSAEPAETVDQDCSFDCLVSAFASDLESDTVSGGIANGVVACAPA